MIVPSIDIMDGHAVQLVGGKGQPKHTVDCMEAADKLSVAGRMTVIDLDAALGNARNEDCIKQIISKYPCNVGGGIRSAEAALSWLSFGAAKVILGTAAIIDTDILKSLPRDRIIVALDCIGDEVMLDGWRKRSGITLKEAVDNISQYTDELLITFEHEGRMKGISIVRVHKIKKYMPECKIIMAGGISSELEIKMLDELGIDAQVGMAIYSGKLGLADAITAPLQKSSLWPTVICDESGVALGLAYSTAESVREAVRKRKGIYYSRSRNEIWEKGSTSGNWQRLRRIDLDCDRDTLRFIVRQEGEGFCHNGTWSCWQDSPGLGDYLPVLVSLCSR